MTADIKSLTRTPESTRQDRELFAFLGAVREAMFPPHYTLATIPTSFVGPVLIVSDAAAGQKVRAWSGTQYVA